MSEWINVKDRLPENGKIVLVSDGDRVVKGLISNIRISPHHYGGWILLEPLTMLESHWMPLPKPPNG